MGPLNPSSLTELGDTSLLSFSKHAARFPATHAAFSTFSYKNDTTPIANTEVKGEIV